MAGNVLTLKDEEGHENDFRFSYVASNPPAIIEIGFQYQCPSCSAIGTFNLHRAENGRPWRWLCKYCGYYHGPEGAGRICYPSRAKGCWMFKSQAVDCGDTDTRTPLEVVFSELGNTWPWRK